MRATMDDALEILEDAGPEFGGGLANHGPMAAEALLALGRDDVVVPWTENYRRRLREYPEARNPIGDDWREALGDAKRVGDWIQFFDRELAERPWRDAVNVWSLRLAPGIIASATHGVIRTGHAVRSIAQQETRARKHELAQGLGYWAARYRTLPEATGDATGARMPSDAIGAVHVVPAADRRAGRLITDGLSSLDTLPSFADVAALVDVSGDASRFISDLTETFAGVYLTNASATAGVITFIHSVTGPSAVRLLLPYLDDEATRACLRYAWQTAAALYVAFGATAGIDVAGAPVDADDIVERAVAGGDEHAIKFAEACLREHALNAKDVYLAAAQHASLRLGARAV